MQHVEQNHQERVLFRQAFVLGKNKGGDKVADDRYADHQKTQADFKVQVVNPLGDDQSACLTDNRPPAQKHQRAKSDPASALARFEGGGGVIYHMCDCVPLHAGKGMLDMLKVAPTAP